MTDIQALYEAGDFASFMGYWCKGHENKEEFRNRVDQEFGITSDYYDFSPDDVEHVLWRCVPLNDGSGSWVFHPCSKPGRGVFKATVVNLPIRKKT